MYFETLPTTVSGNHEPRKIAWHFHEEMIVTAGVYFLHRVVGGIRPGYSRPTIAKGQRKSGSRDNG
jgi:hypothetical protein